MKRLLLTSSLAVLLLSSVTAIASPDKDKGHEKHDRDRHGQYDDRDRRDGDRRHDDRRHDNGRHLGHAQQAWKRGGYAPREYLGDRYYVRDYRAYRLSAPPRGYRWVRPEADSDRYLLVQATTGLISQVFGY